MTLPGWPCFSATQGTMPVLVSARAPPKRSLRALNVSPAYSSKPELHIAPLRRIVPMMRNAQAEDSHNATAAAKRLGRKSGKGFSNSNSGSDSGLIQWPGLGINGAAGPLEYNNGPLLTNPITVHFIFYGSWGQDFGESVLYGFVNSLSDSSADSLVEVGNTTYVDNTSPLSDGSNGSPDDFVLVVQDQISQGNLPLDSNAFYAVITSQEVLVGDSVNGFCAQYCGWHSSTQVDGTTIQYGFIGDSTQQCPNSCGGSSFTPNGYPAIDNLVGTFAHELVETATDPDTRGGYRALDQDGMTTWENADLCNYYYTDLLTDYWQDYEYNLFGINGLKFKISTNVDVDKQECVLQAW